MLHWTFIPGESCYHTENSDLAVMIKIEIECSTLINMQKFESRTNSKIIEDPNFLPNAEK